MHDRHDPDGGQSDHEEVYYHLLRGAGQEGGDWAIQTLFNGHDVNQAYIVKNRTIMAIPGAAHSIVAGPTSDMLYVWGLAGIGTKLRAWDMPEFRFLHSVEQAWAAIERRRSAPKLPERTFQRICREHRLSARAERLLRFVLLDRGWRFGAPRSDPARLEEP